jgi:hypothetical protein
MRSKSSVKGLAKHLLKKEYIYSLLIFVYEFMHNISWEKYQILSTDQKINKKHKNTEVSERVYEW